VTLRWAYTIRNDHVYAARCDSEYLHELPAALQTWVEDPLLEFDNDDKLKMLGVFYEVICYGGNIMYRPW